jgi:hypothetical protein
VSAESTLKIERLRAGSVFRIVAAGSFSFLVPFALLMGVFALFGFHTVTWNKEPVTGLRGLLLSPLIGVFVAALFTVFYGIVLVAGLWIYSRFRPLTLAVKGRIPADTQG